MIEGNTETSHVEGPPWHIHKRFSTYEEANEHRNGLLFQTNNIQVKVHWMGTPNHRFFAVKTRIDPEVALAEEVEQKRQEKKRRKAKLSKKRRKK